LRWDSPSRGRKRRLHPAASRVAATKRPKGADNPVLEDRVHAVQEQRGRRDGVGETASHGPTLSKYKLTGDQTHQGKGEQLWIAQLKLMHDIETNPGPTKRSKLHPTREERKADNKRQRKARQLKRRSQKEEKQQKAQQKQSNSRPRIATWNAQRATVVGESRHRFMQMIKMMETFKIDALMITEIQHGQSNMEWIEGDNTTTAIVYGHRTAIALRGIWAKKWHEDGCQRWIGERVMAVLVNGFRLVSCYWPVWGSENFESVRDQCEDDVSRQVRLNRSKEWLIIAGDFNSVMGKGERPFDTNSPCGPFGIQGTNEAGRSMIRFLQEEGLVWVNSFFSEPNRGTWWNRSLRKWYELDGFLALQQQRHALFQKVETIPEDSTSDHRPKLATLNKKIDTPHTPNQPGRRKAQIEWEKLREDEAQAEYERQCAQRIAHTQHMDRWETLAEVMREEAEKVCGKRARQGDSPWLRGRERQIDQFKASITSSTAKIREIGTTIRTMQGREEDTTLMMIEEEAAKCERRLTRREYKASLKRWEEAWWECIIQKAKEAADRNEVGRMYKLLRELGLRGSKINREQAPFTAEEFKAQFSSISNQRYENTNEEIANAIDAIEVNATADTRHTANEKLDANITREEIQKALTGVQEKAPGSDNVRKIMITAAGAEMQGKIFDIVQNMFQTPAAQWSDIAKKGQVIPLFKKGDRANVNNYRGVCLLSMISRILARILATRLRSWAEELDIMGETQAGFRQNRSTADGTQIIRRINEEVQRRRGTTQDNMAPEDQPCATLLDLKKAYPRVNKPILWAILKKWGVPERILRTLKGLHEATEYSVLGKDGESQSWMPERGLREGCATSPVLFNVYHAMAMREAHNKRSTTAAANEKQPGIEWRWIPGNFFPPEATRRANNSSEAERFFITHSLFADDTTIIGTKSELEAGIRAVKQGMAAFEERCNDAKEEKLTFAGNQSKNIRVLGSWIGRKEDVANRLARGRKAWWIVRKRLVNSRINKKLRARVVEACVEYGLLFDCAIRPWRETEIKVLQQFIDRCYRYIWRDPIAIPTLIQMQQRHTNSYGIRRQMGIKSVKQKIETRTLERIGHLLRLPDHSLVKKVTLGWDAGHTSTTNNSNNHLATAASGERQTTLHYYYRVIRNAGYDPDQVSNKTTDRKEWKAIIKERRQHMEQYEEWRAERHARNSNQANDNNDTEESIPTPWSQWHPDIGRSTTCDIEGCNKTFRNTTNLKIHRARIHKIRTNPIVFNCEKCQFPFKTAANRRNHEKRCAGTQPGTCPYCLRSMARKNMARHHEGVNSPTTCGGRTPSKHSTATETN